MGLSTITTIVLTMLAYCAKAQSNFKNQGEQERYVTEQIFKTEYLRHNIEKFKGNITVVDKNIIQYDTVVLKVFCSDSVLMKIFTTGIFYPGVFSQEINKDSIQKIRTLSNSNSSTDSNSNISTSYKNDSISISNIEELNFVEHSHKVRRFKFLVWYKWLLNPCIYYIELTNENATDTLSLRSFIIDSKLTFIKRGSIIH